MSTHTTINLRINGELKQVSAELNVMSLLESYRLKVDGIAVEVNSRVLARHEFVSTFLSDGDQVEIVHFVGGG